jgi:predicted aspartyl protease
LRFSFNSNAKIVVVQAELQGPVADLTVNLLVDTGASWTVLRQSTLLLAGYKLSNAVGKVPILTASGLEGSPRIVVSRLRALGHDRSPFGILCHELPAGIPAHGLLGLDFMRRHRLSIDFPNGTISLR